MSCEGLGSSSADIFEVKERLEVPRWEGIQLSDKYSEGHLNFFAFVIKRSSDIVLVSDEGWPINGTEKEEEDDKCHWRLRHIPWFHDHSKRISALSFDDEGVLFIGTCDGSVFELQATKLLTSHPLAELPEIDLEEVCHLTNVKVVNILVYNQEGNKIILCNGDDGKFVILTRHAPPVLVTFTSHILALHLFVNKTGLTCALVCLESGQNVYTILDDLDLSAIQNESLGKKSLFKKAKDNLMSRLSDDKMSFFGKKSNKEGSLNTFSSTTGPNVVSTATVSSSSNQNKVVPLPLNNVKFQSIDEISCRGLLRKIKRQTSFFRHVGTKLDVFDGDFRQTAAIFIPSSVIRLFVIQRMYFGVDEEQECIRVFIIYNAVLKEFAVIPFSSRVLSIEPYGEEGTPYTVFIVAENGIHEVHLRKSPIETCVDLLLKETGNNLLESVCSALNVPKTQVCILAGDARSEEGKFSKTIIYYKLAGLTYAQICAKFGSRGQIPAMLFFFELVDQERTKLAGGSQDRQLMADLSILGRIEQYLRYGLVRSELPRNPHSLLKKLLVNNIYYSCKKAAKFLAIPELMWALKIIGQSRFCYPNILSSLYENDAQVTSLYLSKKLFWKVLTTDWLAIYTAEPGVFFWFRDLVMKVLRRIDTSMLHRLIKLLLPWRRELQRKIFTEISDLVHIIDFTGSPDAGRVVIDDYVGLFIILLLEAVRRKTTNPLKLPVFTFKSDARNVQKDEILKYKTNMVATMMLSYTFVKSFSASGNHCACVRNGKVYTWGENKTGRLGTGSEKGRGVLDTPTPIYLSPSLKIYIESVCAGHSHNIALTNFGTIIVWGSNKLGQLGLGKKTSWTGRPVALDIPDVIFTCISAGSYHSVAIDHLNRVWTWGWGIFGQLGYGGIENRWIPKITETQDKIVFVSAGHSHTAILTCYGKVLTFGCNHFGQLGIGQKEGKGKKPSMITALPTGTIIRLVECGVCSTVMVTTKNRLFYTGLNPASLKSLISSARKREKPTQAEIDEEKDFNKPTLIDTTHMAGDISKVSAASTHFAVMTSLGYVYTWGIGKSGQLVRPDDDSKTLELIDCDEKMIIASDICCAGDCTFVVDRDNGTIFGCGFNSSGQLGRMESDEEKSVMTIRTKKRVVKVRQPSNIYFRLRGIPGLPKQLSWEGDTSLLSSHKISPQTNIVGQELLEWCLKVFRRNYDAKQMSTMCVEVGNFAAASLLETLAHNHELALKHNLAAAGSKKGQTTDSLTSYLDTVGQMSPSVEQACRFLVMAINHWTKYGLPSSDLEDFLEIYRNRSPWGSFIKSAIKEIIATADESAEWMSANLTPLFILGAIKDTPLLSPSTKKSTLTTELTSVINSPNNGHLASDSDEASSTEHNIINITSPTTDNANGNAILNGLRRE